MASKPTDFQKANQKAKNESFAKRFIEKTPSAIKKSKQVESKQVEKEKRIAISNTGKKLGDASYRNPISGRSKLSSEAKDREHKIIQKNKSKKL